MAETGKVAFKLNTRLLAEVDQLIASGLYATKSDFYREAIRTHIFALKRLLNAELSEVREDRATD